MEETHEEAPEGVAGTRACSAVTAGVSLGITDGGKMAYLLQVMTL